MTDMIPTVNVTYAANGKSKKTNELGMRNSACVRCRSAPMPSAASSTC